MVGAAYLFCECKPTAPCVLFPPRSAPYVPFPPRLPDKGATADTLSYKVLVPMLVAELPGLRLGEAESPEGLVLCRPDENWGCGDSVQ